MRQILKMRAAAASLVALAMVTVLGVGVPSVSAHTARAGTEADASLASVETLLSTIQSDVRSTCARREPSSFANGSFATAGAVVECASPARGVVGIVYALYPDASTMDADYQAIVPTGLGTMTVAAGCTGAGTWAYGDGNPTAGKMACFTTTPSEGPIGRMVWTSDAAHILGSAATLNASGDTLKAWWRDGSSLVLAPPDSVEFASTTAADRLAAGKTLARKLSKAVTKCKQPADWSVFNADTAEWAWLPWLRAEQLCTVPSGVAYYDQLAPEAAKGY